jgi:hypothetical protein
MIVSDFSEIEEEFLDRIRTTVWCSVATVDSRQRPRSRIMHPIWEGSTGWIGTHRNSYKSRHLERNPYVSLAYIAEIMKPVYVECTAEWVEDPEERRRIWDLFANTPPPVGYDPVPDFISPDHANFGVLKLAPWRITLVTFPAPSYEEGQRVHADREAIHVAPDRDDHDGVACQVEGAGKADLPPVVCLFAVYHYGCVSFVVGESGGHCYRAEKRVPTGEKLLPGGDQGVAAVKGSEEIGHRAHLLTFILVRRGERQANNPRHYGAYLRLLFEADVR